MSVSSLTYYLESIYNDEHEKTGEVVVEVNRNGRRQIEMTDVPNMSRLDVDQLTNMPYEEALSFVNETLKHSTLSKFEIETFIFYDVEMHSTHPEFYSPSNSDFTHFCDVRMITMIKEIKSKQHLKIYLKKGLKFSENYKPKLNREYESVETVWCENPSKTFMNDVQEIGKSSNTLLMGYNSNSRREKFGSTTKVEETIFSGDQTNGGDVDDDMEELDEPPRIESHVYKYGFDLPAILRCAKQRIQPYHKTWMKAGDGSFNMVTSYGNVLCLDLLPYIGWIYSKSSNDKTTYNTQVNRHGNGLSAWGKYICGKGKLDMTPEEINAALNASIAADRCLDYNIQDVVLVIDIFKKIGGLDWIHMITGALNTSYDGALSSSSKFLSFEIKRQLANNQIHSDLHEKAKSIGLKDKIHQIEKFVGGAVHSPIGGRHKIVLYCDVNSEYPSVIMQFNICFTTYIGNSVDGFLDGTSHIIDYHVVKDVDGKDCYYRKDIVGVLPTFMRRWFRLRQIMKSLGISANAALKIAQNSFYGVVGSKTFEYNYQIVAASITSAARHVKSTMEEICKNIGLTAVYGDTDSLFLTLSDSFNLDFKEELEACLKNGDMKTLTKYRKRLVDIINQEFINRNLEFCQVSSENVKPDMFFPGHKKRYICETLDNEIKVAGFKPTKYNETLCDFACAFYNELRVSETPIEDIFLKYITSIPKYLMKSSTDKEGEKFLVVQRNTGKNTVFKQVKVKEKEKYLTMIDGRIEEVKTVNGLLFKRINGIWVEADYPSTGTIDKIINCKIDGGYYYNLLKIAPGTYVETEHDFDLTDNIDCYNYMVSDIITEVCGWLGFQKYSERQLGLLRMVKLIFDEHGQIDFNAIGKDICEQQTTIKIQPNESTIYPNRLKIRKIKDMRKFGLNVIPKRKYGRALISYKNLSPSEFDYKLEQVVEQSCWASSLLCGFQLDGSFIVGVDIDHKPPGYPNSADESGRIGEAEITKNLFSGDLFGCSGRKGRHLFYRILPTNKYLTIPYISKIQIEDHTEIELKGLTAANENLDLEGCHRKDLSFEFKTFGDYENIPEMTDELFIEMIQRITGETKIETVKLVRNGTKFKRFKMDQEITEETLASSESDVPPVEVEDSDIVDHIIELLRPYKYEDLWTNRTEVVKMLGNIQSILSDGEMENLRDAISELPEYKRCKNKGRVTSIQLQRSRYNWYMLDKLGLLTNVVKERIRKINLQIVFKKPLNATIVGELKVEHFHTDAVFTVIEAPLSAGKTYQLMKYLENTSPKTKIVYVCNRQKQVEELIKRYGEGNAEKVMEKCKPNLSKSVFLVQFESLYKLTKLDYSDGLTLVCDEAVTLVGQVASNLCHELKYRNTAMLRQFQQCCERGFVMDGLITPGIIAAFTVGRSYTLISSNFHRMTPKLYWHEKEVSIHTAIETALDAGERIGVAFDNVGYLEGMVSWLEQKKIKYLTFVGQNYAPEVVDKKDGCVFIHPKPKYNTINDLEDSHQVILYTSTLIHTVSFETKFDKMFGIFHHFINTAHCKWQMLNRCRTVREIHFFHIQPKKSMKTISEYGHRMSIRKTAEFLSPFLIKPDNIVKCLNKQTEDACDETLITFSFIHTTLLRLLPDKEHFNYLFKPEEYGETFITVKPQPDDCYKFEKAPTVRPKKRLDECKIIATLNTPEVQLNERCKIISIEFAKKGYVLPNNPATPLVIPYEEFEAFCKTADEAFVATKLKRKLSEPKYLNKVIIQTLNDTNMFDCVVGREAKHRISTKINVTISYLQKK